MYEQIEKELINAMDALDRAMSIIMRLPGNTKQNEQNTGILEQQKKNIQKVLQKDYDQNARKRQN